MAYSDFTIGKVKQDLGIKLVEGGRFLPQPDPIEPSPIVVSLLQEYLPWAIAVGTEKAKSETIIAPLLLEVKRFLNHRISVFSGSDFTVDKTLGLSGICDFLISRSTEQLEIEAPVLVVVEAKRDNLNSGLGQCMAEMVAAQKFNEANHQAIDTIYGSVTTGTAWRLLKLEGQTITIDLQDYSLHPLAEIFSLLVWIADKG
jgi:hypothetical protein